MFPMAGAMAAPGAPFLPPTDILLPMVPPSMAADVPIQDQGLLMPSATTAGAISPSNIEVPFQAPPRAQSNAPDQMVEDLQGRRKGVQQPGRRDRESREARAGADREVEKENMREMDNKGAAVGPERERGKGKENKGAMGSARPPSALTQPQPPVPIAPEPMFAGAAAEPPVERVPPPKPPKEARHKLPSPLPGASSSFDHGPEMVPPERPVKTGPSKPPPPPPKPKLAAPGAEEQLPPRASNEYAFIIPICILPFSHVFLDPPANPFNLILFVWINLPLFLESVDLGGFILFSYFLDLAKSFFLNSFLMYFYSIFVKLRILNAF